MADFESLFSEEDEECLLLLALHFLRFLGPEESLLLPDDELLSDSDCSLSDDDEGD